MKQLESRRLSSVSPVRLACAGLASVSLVVAGASIAPSEARAPSGDNRSRDPATSAAAVVKWNDTASAALGTDTALSAPVMAVGMAYVQAAVYNAVVGITGGAPLYRWHARGPSGASTDAAVAAAARGVLTAYFPLSQARVDAEYATSLAAIPDGTAKTAGIQFGERSAQHLLTTRQGDGWMGPVTYDVAPEPGIWRPTPPAMVPYLAPWLGLMRPFTMREHDQFRPGPPPSLRSARYTHDLLEVQSLGSATSTTRTAEQTEIARFFGGNLASQLQGGYRDHVVRHGLDARAAARYFLVATLAGADAVITAWDAKLTFHNWRPVTAIQLADSDGNPRTTADPTWAPLIVTPPFPDYLSGHTTVIGAVLAALHRLDRTSVIDLNLTSLVTGTTRHYEVAEALDQEGIGARIWGGIHFRTADEMGSRVGSRVGLWSATHLR
jgi:hypothetical protein